MPRGVLETAGDIAALTARTLRYTRYTAVHHFPEVIRQAGLMVTGSLGVILLICSFAGGTCGLEMEIIGRQFGAVTLVPGAVVLCTTREIAPFVFGYILAAKIGCGIVAELSAMHARDEIDAIDVIGVRSVAFLLTSRMLAAALVLPFTFILSQVCASASSYVVSELRFGDLSAGTWIYQFFSFLQAADVPRVILKGVAMSGFVMSVSLYYGFRTRGGPVEVGVATARSMAVNIVGVTIINVGLSLVFWGVGAPFPIA
jgi:phospholipid/cholesterol/gamma-HCH transport system permease protein